GEDIIDFLSQIEDFQKRLWEKKKFVLKTDYVITTDRIKEWTDDEFYKEVIDKVLRTKEQLEEWKELGFGDIKDEKDLEGKKFPLDTNYFDEEFKLKLLEKISEKYDLDDVLDGILIKSENWQALNLLLNKYKEKVQTIYIDPPFNKEQDADYLYNVRYKDSTWISMLENR
ncbi:MAG: site-specific DNA-methyltransferase, partial [Brevinematia bacterium]